MRERNPSTWVCVLSRDASPDALVAVAASPPRSEAACNGVPCILITRSRAIVLSSAPDLVLGLHYFRHSSSLRARNVPDGHLAGIQPWQDARSTRHTHTGGLPISCWCQKPDTEPGIFLPAYLMLAVLVDHCSKRPCALLHRAMDTLIMPAWHPGYPNLRSPPQVRGWHDGKEHAM